jgi:hypothetical protein
MRFIYGFLAIVGGLTIVLIAGVVAVVIWWSPSAPTPPDHIVLKLDLRNAPVEATGNDGL